MKALRWHAARDLRLSELERQAPRPGEVELEVAYCGICGSDLHEYQSGPHSIPQAEAHPLSGCRAPLTLGHEFCGVVAALGPGVEGLRIGDRVAVEPEYRCGECRYCREGRYNLCESMGFIGLMGDGGFAERARVPAYMLHRLPDAVGFRQAAVLEPAAVALHALRRSSLAPGQRCAVFGLGPIGLLLVMLARLRGIEDIVAIDVSPERLALAGEFGLALDEALLQRITGFWHRLRPWPDTLAGMHALKADYWLAALSNGNTALMLDVARHAGLPWDMLLCADLFGHYKPDPQVYLGACRLLDLPPQEVMLCAAHNYDLKAARALGLKTAFIARPLEYGPGQSQDLAAEQDWDLIASDLLDLHRQLAASA
ncbi:Sorbitol dehydrogenase [Pseudomonas aeruginosa]|nr:Sorbitol dehydrogenase [Pseudomonas aeruginosa]